LTYYAEKNNTMTNELNDPSTVCLLAFFKNIFFCSAEERMVTEFSFLGELSL